LAFVVQTSNLVDQGHGVTGQTAAADFMMLEGQGSTQGVINGTHDIRWHLAQSFAKADFVHSVNVATMNHTVLGKSAYSAFYKHAYWQRRHSQIAGNGHDYSQGTMPITHVILNNDAGMGASHLTASCRSKIQPIDFAALRQRDDWAHDEGPSGGQVSRTAGHRVAARRRSSSAISR
jgi:hypothetical protein